MKNWFKILPLIIIIIFFSGCMRAFKKSSLKFSESFVPVAAVDIDFADDLDQASLEAAIDHSSAGLLKSFILKTETMPLLELMEWASSSVTMMMKARVEALR